MNVKVIGVGGCGGNMADYIMATGLPQAQAIECIRADSDFHFRSLHRSKTHVRLPLGPQITHGAGCGTDADLGRQAAFESRDQIREALRGADMVFIVAGMGGGTGTGSAPVIAEIAKDTGIHTVGMVTLPFGFEGGSRVRLAQQGVTKLSECVDMLLIYPNEDILKRFISKVSLMDAFRTTNDMIREVMSSLIMVNARWARQRPDPQPAN